MIAPTDGRQAHIAWSIISNPGDVAAQQLRAMHGAVTSLDMVRAGDPRIDSRNLERWQHALVSSDFDAILSRSTDFGIRAITPEDAEWPTRLNDLGTEVPAALWAVGPGSLGALGGISSVAMVGSRASTSYGEAAAASIASSIANHSGVVISGGAYGIDAASHRGALSVGGATIAVLASGLDQLTPRGNQQLLSAIARRYVVIGESPIGVAPVRHRLLARNRIIAALADCVLVVEASVRSGTMSTVHAAERLNRSIGAVPGPVTSAASSGTNGLIRDRRASLVTGYGDLPGHA